MTVNNSTSRGFIVSKQTASTTIAINAGYIVEYDGSGNVVLATTTPGIPIGVAVSNVAARATATQKYIAVQVAGVAPVICAANETFTAGGYVSQGVGGVATTMASLAGTTFSSEGLRKVVGRCLEPDATTTGTTILVIVGAK